MRRGNAAQANARERRAVLRRPLGVETLESRCMMAASVNPLSVPQLASRPAAPATLYLDFDGHVESRWGNRTNVVTPAYDTDGNKASFSAAELAAIREIFARVAEDYAPLNINVTTIAPPVIADRVAARVAIGGGYADWYGNSAGGVSYVGGFAGPASNVAYVFSATLGSGNPRFVAEAASHEAGHLFGLEHHATWSNGQLVAEYNSGTATVAPVMGLSYYANRTLWSKGPTGEGPTAMQDDLAVLASGVNGFGYAADDHGDTLAAAKALATNSVTASAGGVIGREGDRDVFKFVTGGGQIGFTLDVAQYGANLDGVLELQNATGQAVATANPSETLGATLTKTLAAGTYYLVVRASGGYGNLGRYTLRGTIPAMGSSPPMQPPASTPAPPASVGTVQIADDGTAPFAATGTWKKVASGYAGDTQHAAAGSGGTAAWTFTGLAPGKYRLAATWAASALNAASAPFSVSSGSKLLGSVRVNQQRAASTFASGGAAWQNLGTFTVTGSTLTVRLNSALSGRVVADAIRLERV